MKTRLNLFTLTILLLVYSAGFSQTTGYSGTGANIDVKYHRAEWTITPDGTKNISGKVTTYFVTTVDNVASITFDLDAAHTFSATYHGSAITTSRPSANIIRLNLPATLASGTLDSVVISYSGAPPTFGNYGEGFEEHNTVTGHSGYVVYTLAESYGDDDWWPCKADMKDKIDSMDFIITTPSTFRAATNGVLITDVVSGATRVMTYKHRYPIPSYLVCVGVASYNVFDRGTVNINGTAVPIEYYIYSGHGTNPTTQLTAMDFCKQELVAFSNVFGDYPFKKEKYGMYEFGWGGGMEHQTFSAMSWGTMSSWSVIAHELAHQWWGDKVTFATWNHLWLAEGFAKYSEVLAAELVPGLGQDPIAHRTGIQTTALNTSTNPIYLSNTEIANSNLLWTTSNDDALYKRGAMVVSMLRKLAGDAKFFQACRNYLNDPALAYKSATTDNLKNHFEAVLGYDLDPFFNDYIYGTGNPNYNVKWNNTGNRIAIQLASQTRSTSSTVAYFRTPVVVRITNGLTGASLKDTIVVIYDQNGSLSFAGNGISAPRFQNSLAYTLSFTPTAVTYDPYDETLTTGTVSPRDATINPLAYSTLPVTIVDFKGAAQGTNHWLHLKMNTTGRNQKVSLEKSMDGVRFVAVGTKDRITSSGNEASYQFTDQDVSATGSHFYRALTFDESGEAVYSK
ncbi:MAG TPA: M1 family metallopeptidase, partial [Flavisolibacter sp.]|nr:M1 family metallopeptidase [Flavisolibacter sp.]